jgi:hypothetical protein
VKFIFTRTTHISAPLPTLLLVFARCLNVTCDAIKLGYSKNLDSGQWEVESGQWTIASLSTHCLMGHEFPTTLYFLAAVRADSDSIKQMNIFLKSDLCCGNLLNIAVKNR